MFHKIYHCIRVCYVFELYFFFKKKFIFRLSPLIGSPVVTSCSFLPATCNPTSGGHLFSGTVFIFFIFLFILSVPNFLLSANIFSNLHYINQHNYLFSYLYLYLFIILGSEGGVGVALSVSVPSAYIADPCITKTGRN